MFSTGRINPFGAPKLDIILRMRANSAWGFLALAFVFWSLRFSMIWTTGHEEYGPYLLWAGIALAILSLICFVWPWLSGKGKSFTSDALTSGANSPVSTNQSGGISIQGDRNSLTIQAAQAISPFNDGDAQLNTAKSEIALVFGYDGHYVEADSHNSINIMKSVCVGVKNAGTTHLSNCKLKFEARRADDATPEIWLRDGPFSLSVGEERYLGVAFYNEPISPQTIPETWIRLSAPPSGNFWQPPRIPVSGGAVTLIATSADCRECRTILKLWANEGKLYWEEAVSGVARATPAPSHRNDEDCQYIPMPDAAATVYGELRSANSSWSKAADWFAQHGVGEQIYFAGAIAGEVPIYGKHPPSRLLEVISADELKRGLFKNDGASFHYHGDANPQYVDIAVRNGDLSRAIEQMRDKVKDVSW
jgi:hypothetical protein